jgi:mannose-6-phosphate isomerase-like protein (cupin superfamily)
MKPSLIALFLSVAFCAPVVAADAPPTDVIVIDRAKVDEAFTKGGPLQLNSAFKIQAGRRDAAGQVEIHTRDTDIFYLTEGTATLITGGQAVDPKEIAPGELRADKLIGGVTRKISKGDVVIIPAGIPHWMPEVSKPFLYFVVKVTK